MNACPAVDVPAGGVYELYGVPVRSSLPLPGRRLADPSERDTALTLHWRYGPTVPAEPPRGDVMFENSADGARRYTAVRQGRSALLRFHGLCDLIVPDDGSDLCCLVGPGQPREIVPLMFAGTGMAFVLTLRGDLVLHGSAVDIGGTAVAVVGPSGAGKSTIAANLCAAGAGFVTDDVLRVAFRPEPVTVGGCTEVRLRQTSTAVAATRDAVTRDVVSRTTVDDRLAASLPSSPATELPLAMVLLPSPSSTGRVRLERMAPADAAVRLFSAPRLTGCRPAPLLERHFDGVSRLARSVPVVDAHVPWGRDFPHPEELLDAVKRLG